MGRNKAVSDKEFIRQVERCPNAKTVAFYTEYSIPTVQRKVRDMRLNGIPLVYGQIVAQKVEELEKELVPVVDTIRPDDATLTAMQKKYEEEAKDWVEDDDPTLLEFADDWDKACAILKELANVEYAHHEALLMNEGFDLGLCKGIVRGYTTAIVEEAIIDTTLDDNLQKLLDLFMEMQPNDTYTWHETFKHLWDSLEGVL